MSTIKAGTTTGTALVTEGDTTGQLVFQTNGTTTALTIGTNQTATFSGNVAVNGTLTASGGLPSLATPLAVVGNATAGSEIRLPEDTDNGANYVAIKAPNALAANLTLTLPTADGTNGQVLQTNGSGALAFANIAVANGGTGATTLTANAVLIGNGTSAISSVAPGTTGNILTSNGTAWTSAAAPTGGFSNVVVFTSSGSWSVPAGVTKCKVTVTGGGGGVVGRSNNSASGAAGGTAIKIVSLSGGSATITVGAAGSTSGTNGGDSSFVYSATTVSGNGGTGTVAATFLGGTATGGDINIPGGDAGVSDESNYGGKVGGSSFWGGGGYGSALFSGGSGQGANGRAYGSGAGGCGNTKSASGAPGGGVIEY